MKSSVSSPKLKEEQSYSDLFVTRITFRDLSMHFRPPHRLSSKLDGVQFDYTCLTR